MMRHIMTIEYEYTRVYINALGLQAVIGRCLESTTSQNHANTSNNMAADTASGVMSGNAIPSSVVEKYYGEDIYYIAQVQEGSRNLLSAVVDGLYPGEFLRHAPVRTYFRIISIAIIFLKVRRNQVLVRQYGKAKTFVRLSPWEVPSKMS